MWKRGRQQKNAWNRISAKRILMVPLLLCLALAACKRNSLTEDDFTSAKEAAAEQDWAQAARLVQRYLRGTETDPEKRWEAWKLLIDASETMGEFSWALDYRESMLLEFGGDQERSLDILKDLGKEYEKTRQWSKATAVWLRMLETGSLSPGEVADIYQRIGRVHQNNLEFVPAREMFEQCAENADSPGVKGICLYSVADVLSAEEELDKSLEYIDQLLAIDGLPDEVRGMALLLQGDIFQQKGQVADAKKIFQRALMIHPNPSVVEARLKRMK